MRRRTLDPLIVAVLATAVSLGGAGRPSFWYDEAATISASYSRSLGQLWQMLSNVDAVHGLYYLLMHGWFRIFPPTEFWSRVPSALAVGGAAAGVVVLARQFSPRTVALASGVFFAILPRTTWAGIEARPYALSMVAAVWLTPQMDRLFQDGASDRRRFLDRLVWALEPHHAREVAAYDHAMAQRNRLLHEGRAAARGARAWSARHPWQ